MPEQPVLTTERLVLRCHTVADASSSVTHLESGEVAATMVSIPYPYDIRMAEWWIENLPARREQGHIDYAITLSESGEYIGSIGLNNVDMDSARAEIGYWIGKPWRGQGYGTEAAAAVVRYGFTVMGLNRIYATHFRNNPASGRVMQKIGMTYEGRWRQHFRKNGEYVDFELYAILRSEYRQ